MPTMATRIRARRKELKLTQAALAYKTELGSQTIWRLEHDSGQSKLYVVERVARELGVTVEFLMHGAPKKASAA